MKPLIGITVDSMHQPEDVRTGGRLSLNWNYAKAVADAGGVPLLIPPMADMSVLAGVIHGWLIPGGDDIDATRWGEENHPEARLQDPGRFDGEKRLYDALPAQTPILGICYGCQFLNVARGGSLIQHLPDLVEHDNHAGGTLQEYKIEESKLRQIAGSRMTGKSYHHQAVKELGAGLQAVARAEDGTVEAIEATDRPWVIGVQWHPERTFEDGATRALFTDFVRKAQAFAETRDTAGTW